MAMGAFSNRLHYAAPHIGAMLASVPGYFGYVAISLGFFHPLVDVAVLFFLAASPVIGSTAVIKLQGREVKWRGPTVRPYVWWAVTTAVGISISWVLGAIFAPAEPTIEALKRVATWLNAAGFIWFTSIAVPFVVAALRFIMWMIKPPIEKLAN